MEITQLFIIKLILLALAVYRLSLLITEETGFAGIFKKIRKKAGVETYIATYVLDNGDEYQEEKICPIQKTYLAEGITCINCVSLILSFSVLLFTFYTNIDIMTLLLLPFSLGTLVLIVNRIFR